METPTNNVIEGVKIAQWSDKTVNTGILYQNNRPPFHAQIPELQAGTLYETTGKKRDISKLLENFK